MLGDPAVVGNERLERGVAVLFELALNEVAAAAAAGGAVSHSDHAVDALAVQDAFPGGDGVAGELDTLADLDVGAAGDGVGSFQRQVAVDR